MFGNKKKLEQELAKQGGTTAWATIASVSAGWSSGSANGFGQVLNATDHMKVSLRVEPDGAEPFEAEFRQAFKGRVPMQGWQCKVIYDPADHSKIAVVEDSVIAPGIDHDRADRASALRRDVREAVRSGHLDEFAADQKAKAARGEFGGGLVIVNGQVVSGGGAARPDVADQLTKLAALRDRGVLTDAEFEGQKAKLLAAD